MSTLGDDELMKTSCRGNSWESRVATQTQSWSLFAVYVEKKKKRSKQQVVGEKKRWEKSFYKKKGQKKS